MTKYVTLTSDMIERGKSSKGGWSMRQLALLGIDWPPPRNWKSKIIGKRVDAFKYAEFMRMRST